jgi:hypothetical protein
MPRRPAALPLLVAAALGAGCGGGDAGPAPAPAPEPGLQRYRAYAAAEAASLAERVRAGAYADARVHAGRLAPLARATGAVELLAVDRIEPARAPALGRVALRSARAPVTRTAVVRAAARSLEAARSSADLEDVEARVDGAAVAFDSIRDEVWARDQGLVGSIDERLERVRRELRRERPDARRLDARLHALAWRLELAPARAGVRGA